MSSPIDAARSRHKAQLRAWNRALRKLRHEHRDHFRRIYRAEFARELELIESKPLTDPLTPTRLPAKW